MRRDRGQLAFGLAASFTMVLAILGLVLRSGLITREKMQIQRTSDMAALQASNEQRYALNDIRELNKAIETAYIAAQAALEANFSPCAVKYWGLPTIIQVSKEAAVREMVKGEEKDPGSAVDTDVCNVGCKNVDAKWRNRTIDQYDRIRKTLSRAIMDLIVNTGAVADDAAVRTFLTPANLPVGLHRTLTDRLGAGFTTDAAVEAYRRGELSDEYQLVEYFRDLPLFKPAEEHLAFHYQKMSYSKPVSGVNCVFAGPPQNKFAHTKAKIFKDSDYKTAFLTGAKYIPARKDDVGRFALYEKSGEEGHFGEETTGPEGKKIQIFHTRLPIGAYSLAKPYGGTFPKAAIHPKFPVLSLYGDEFEGVKLIGLADKDQIGIELPLGGTVGLQDSEGHELEGSTYYLEDFLH